MLEQAIERNIMKIVHNLRQRELVKVLNFARSMTEDTIKK